MKNNSTTSTNPLYADGIFPGDETLKPDSPATFRPYVCAMCEPGKGYNPTTKQCKACEGKEYIDPDTHQCKICPDDGTPTDDKKFCKPKCGNNQWLKYTADDSEPYKCVDCGTPCPEGTQITACGGESDYVCGSCAIDNTNSIYNADRTKKNLPNGYKMGIKSTLNSGCKTNASSTDAGSIQDIYNAFKPTGTCGGIVGKTFSCSDEYTSEDISTLKEKGCKWTHLLTNVPDKCKDGSEPTEIINSDGTKSGIWTCQTKSDLSGIVGFGPVPAFKEDQCKTVGTYHVSGYNPKTGNFITQCLTGGGWFWLSDWIHYN